VIRRPLTCTIATF